MTFRYKLERFPPLVCYLIARKGNGRHIVHIGVPEITRLSNLPRSSVERLTWLCSWDDVCWQEIIPYTTACGLQIDGNLDHHSKFLRRQLPLFPYLRRNYEAYTNHHEPRIQLYKQFLTNEIHREI